ncbi:MAG: LPS export ABC transporter periplasmic protein LptC [bacterium]|nr:LPS export ABC transporter periplasmic protein LptC [bacterium]
MKKIYPINDSPKYRLRYFLVVLMLAFVLAACGDESASDPGTIVDTKAEKEKMHDQPIQQFFDYQLVETAGGVRKWIMDSELMNKYSGQRDAELVTLKIDFYQDGSHFSTLTADSGLVNIQTKDIFTWGNVVVINDDGRKLETEELYFDNEKQIIHNDVFDRFSREFDVVEGIGLEATPDLQYIEIKQRVQANVLDTEEGGPN